jgi:hypothetical protein
LYQQQQTKHKSEVTHRKKLYQQQQTNHKIWKQPKEENGRFVGQSLIIC